MTGTPANGTQLRDGRYVVVGVLGEGSQGSTLDAVDKREGCAVAIKRFEVRSARSWKDVELAEREARVLAELRHPGLPAYVEHFEEDGALYLVMERIDGRSLARGRRGSERLAVVDVERMVREVGAVLDYLHGRVPPVIHRDIKPGNVLRREDGSFAVVDFGAVRDGLRPGGGSTVVGTFGYMAPEQFQGRASPKTDVYALGATALALLTGEEPESLPHKGLAIDVDAALAGTSVSASTKLALAKMLAPDPDLRPSSVLQAFPSARTGAGSRKTSSSDSGAAREPRNRHEKRRDEKRRRAEAREESRRMRRARRRRVPFLVWPFVAVGLLLARLAVVVTTKVAVPALLHFLAGIFGRGLYRVADEVRRDGDEALESLDEVAGELSGRDPRPEPIRVRVAPDESGVDDQDEEPDVVDAEVVDDEPRSRRSSRRG